MHIFVGNFTYVLDFMIVEDISSIVDPRLSQVVFGRPFIDVSNMTRDLSSGVVRFTNGAEEIAYKMPHKIEQYNSLSDLEKEHTKSVYLRNKEDKRRGVNYVVSKILGFYKECLELGPEYVTGLEDEGKVMYLIIPLQVFSIWKAFGGNTRDLGSFGKETDETTDLHQHCSRISYQKLETASQITRKAFTNPTTTTSQDMATASSRMIQPIIKNILVTTVLYLMRRSLEVLTVMSSASSAVTYTPVYTNSEPGRVFWGADEVLSDSGSPRVIVYRYDGLPIQSVALPSPDYIPGPEEPQIPPVPQDEDEREPMIIQPHDPDYAPEPIYLEYIPLEDEHVFPVEEQPLPPVDLPTTKSPGYVVESDPEEDPEEYEDDETEDGPVDYPMNGGEDGDNDDDDSSRDDADDDDEDEEDEGEVEEHLDSTDSAVVVPTVENASISLLPEAEVERLLAMPTPPPSPLISLSTPSLGERLARCTAPSAHSSLPPVPSPLLPSSGCPTQTQTLRIASTQALINAVIAALPSPPLPPLPPSLYIPPPVDRRDDIPESKQPPRKRLYLSTLGSRYEARESSTSSPTGGRGIDYGDTWVDPVEAAPEIAPMTLGEVNTRVTELAELHEHDTHDLYALLEDA
ncbi:hypothetical protein Tco_0390342 [Tanacetum coccineum]